MITIQDFAKNFEPYAAPAELVKLLAFQEEVGKFGRYSEGFGLERDDKSGLKSWSEAPEFLARLLPFARANGTGSSYALWVEETGGGAAVDTSSLPVVALGDEGGAHVVAEDVRGLLRILCFDAEPMISLGYVDFYKDEREHKASQNHQKYVEWLAGLGLEPVQDPATIVKAAQAKYRERFEAWFARYYEAEA